MIYAVNYLIPCKLFSSSRIGRSDFNIMQCSTVAWWPSEIWVDHMRFAGSKRKGLSIYAIASLAAAPINIAAKCAAAKHVYACALAFLEYKGHIVSTWKITCNRASFVAAS